MKLVRKHSTSGEAAPGLGIHSLAGLTTRLMIQNSKNIALTATMKLQSEHCDDNKIHLRCEAFKVSNQEDPPNEKCQSCAHFSGKIIQPVPWSALTSFSIS
jgi:hypothetical protein